MESSRAVEVDGAFVVSIPAGWEAEPDEEGGISVAAEEGAGLLHLVSFPQPAGELLDPADELYAFLEEQGIELEDDEVEDVVLADGAEMSICEYVTEPEEADGEESATFWLVGVATAPGNLVFSSYSCAAGEESAEREAVRAMLATLRLHPLDTDRVDADTRR